MRSLILFKYVSSIRSDFFLDDPTLAETGDVRHAIYLSHIRIRFRFFRTENIPGVISHEWFNAFNKWRQKHCSMVQALSECCTRWQNNTHKTMINARDRLRKRGRRLSLRGKYTEQKGERGIHIYFRCWKRWSRELRVKSLPRRGGGKRGFAVFWKCKLTMQVFESCIRAVEEAKWESTLSVRDLYFGGAGDFEKCSFEFNEVPLCVVMKY